PYEATEAERKVFEDGKDSMTAGWTGTFDRLDSYLAGACLGREIRHADRPLRHTLDDQLREALLTGPEGFATRWTN
ncbi:MAG TPA: hypothetical protein VHJ00_09385, partial [Bradyrhizobium sp.]|nr:hypothetical protein [Bradyrhizobium sp.]